MDREDLRKRALEETRSMAIAYYKYIYSDREYLAENKLHLREVHVLMLVGGRQGMTMTEISENLGITLGAVSQIASRLLEKGLIKKQKREDNRRFTIICLTEKGRKAFEMYEQYSEARHQEIGAFFTEFTERDYEMIMRYERLVRDVCEGRIAVNTLPPQESK